MVQKRLVLILAIIFCNLSFMDLSIGHEIENNRIQLILREPHHLSLTMYIKITELTHLTIGADNPYTNFVLTTAPLNNEDFEKILQNLKSVTENNLKVKINDTDPASFVQWKWPDSQVLRSRFNNTAMEIITNKTNHFHEEPIEVHAELVTDKFIESAQLVNTKIFGKILLVWYRPEQSWLFTDSDAPKVKF